MKTTIIITLSILILACGATSGNSVKVNTNGFDNSRVATIEPHGGKCSMTQCLGLGGQWNDKNPNRVFITVSSFLEYVAILGAKLNIDGKIITLENSQLLTDLESVSGLRKSTKAFITDYSTLEKLLAANKVWLQIQTPKGTMEEMIKDGTTTTKAFHALERLRASVDNE